MVEASVFISSTFIDMQDERDILSRIVFPKLRKEFSDRLSGLREVDLRWGVTEAMSRHGGAVKICLDGVEEAAPLVLGLVGDRIGWRPDSAQFAPKHRRALNVADNTFGLTELEMRYAALVAQKANLPGPTILCRGQDLSEKVATDRAIDRSGDHKDPMDARNLRDRLEQLPGARTENYQTFEAFAALAESNIRRMLEEHLALVQAGPVAVSLPKPHSIDRRKERRLLMGARRKRRHILIRGASGVGKTWLLKNIFPDGAPGVEFWDGRQRALREIAHKSGREEFEPSSIEAAITQMSRSLATKRRSETVVIDHFEDAFSVADQADLSVFPARTGKGAQLILSSSNDRLAEQAKALGWTVVVLKAPASENIARFMSDYLKGFSKHLERAQLAALASAPWSDTIGSVLLALDELRRFGVMEALDDRVKELVDCGTGEALCEAVISGVESVLPEKQPSIACCDRNKQSRAVIGGDLRSLG
ncbi:MAG: DUF4062 domain-containing protein [Pseudomonadota bacterium]